MKFTLILLSLFVISGYSFAEGIKSGPLDMTTLNLQPGGKLSFTYIVSGGCAEHEPSVNLKLIPYTGTNGYVSEYVHVVEVIIKDVSSKKDYCEALVHKDGEVDLLPLIKETLVKTGSKLKIGNNFTFKLPNVNQTIH